MDIKLLEQEYLKSKDISILENFLIQKRQELLGFENWQDIPDVKELKSDSPKAIAYRKSASYSLLKQLLLIVSSHSCCKCGSTNDLELHHKHYKTYFNESLNDVLIMCKVCHSKGHNLKSQIFKNKYLIGDNMLNQTKEQTIKNLNIPENFQLMVCWIEQCINDVKNTGTARFEKIDKAIANSFNRTFTEVEKIRIKCGFPNRSKKGFRLINPREIANKYKNRLFSRKDIENELHELSGNKQTQLQIALPIVQSNVQVINTQVTNTQKIANTQITNAMILALNNDDIDKKTQAKVLIELAKLV